LSCHVLFFLILTEAVNSEADLKVRRTPM